MLNKDDSGNMSEEEAVESSHIHILRKEDQKEWFARASAGDEIAQLCMKAASHYLKAMDSQPSACCCCDTLFSSTDIPPTFIILVPVEQRAETVRADVKAVCAECSKQSNQWLVDQGLRREGLAITPPRSGDSIH